MGERGGRVKGGRVGWVRGRGGWMGEREGGVGWVRGRGGGGGWMGEREGGGGLDG